MSKKHHLPNSHININETDARKCMCKVSAYTMEGPSLPNSGNIMNGTWSLFASLRSPHKILKVAILLSPQQCRKKNLHEFLHHLCIVHLSIQNLVPSLEIFLSAIQRSPHLKNNFIKISNYTTYGNSLLTTLP